MAISTNIEQKIRTARAAGYSDEQIKTYLQSQGVDAALVDTTARPGFASRIKSAFTSRVDKAADAQLRDQSKASKVVQTLGQGAGFVGDIAEEAIRSVPIADRALNKAGETIGRSKIAQDTFKSYQSWKAQHPEAAA